VSNGDEQLFSIVDSGNGAYCFTCKANGLKLGCSSRDSGNPLVGCNEADGPLSTFGLIRRDNLLPKAQMYSCMTEMERLPRNGISKEWQDALMLIVLSLFALASFWQWTDRTYVRSPSIALLKA
jgi:hypothetical protein